MTSKQTQNFLTMKERIILQVEHKELSVGKGSELLGLSPRGFLKLRQQYRRHGSVAISGLKRGPKTWHRPWNRTKAEIEERIERYRLLHPLEGPITIAWRLRDEEQLSLPAITIARILKRKGLVRKMGKRRGGPWQEVVADHPGERMQIDSYLPYGRNGPVVMEAIDLYSRYALGFVFDRATMENAALFVDMAVQRAPFRIECFQPDNGSEFKHLFQAACILAGARFEPIPPYSPNCNGRVERLHKTSKYGCYLTLPQPLPLERINFIASLFYRDYNWNRRHQGTGMHLMTPMQKILSYLRSQLPSPNRNLSVIQYKFCAFGPKMVV